HEWAYATLQGRQLSNWLRTRGAREVAPLGTTTCSNFGIRFDVIIADGASVSMLGKPAKHVRRHCRTLLSRRAESGRRLHLPRRAILGTWHRGESTDQLRGRNGRTRRRTHCSQARRHRTWNPASLAPHP